MWLRQPVVTALSMKFFASGKSFEPRIMRKRIAAKERRVHSAAKPQPQRDYPQITQIFRVGSGAGSAQD